MPHVTSVGLDVHARSIAAAAFDPFTGEVAERSFGADPAEVAAWILGFESPKAVYESGPTGFHLCRSLRKLGVDCVVGAVSKMQRPAADRRRKNDRRDAAWLARLLATHNVVEVFVPPEEVEAARDLSRALDDAREDLQRARQRLSKFLLRRGHVYDEVDALGRRRGAWTRSSWRWAYGRVPEGDAARDAFVHYATCVRCAESDKRALERAVAREAASPRWKQTVDALSCIKGIDTVTAFCLASEAGVFSRFRSAPAYASWLGLTPSEHSSGEREARGGHHQGRQRRVATGPRRGRLALRLLLAHPEGHARRGRGGPLRQEALRRVHRQALAQVLGPARRRQAPLRRQRRGGQGAGLLGVGDRAPRRGVPPLVGAAP